MEYNFNNDADAVLPLPGEPEAAAHVAPPEVAGLEPSTPASPPSAGLLRFRSCRWMQPAEHGHAEFCTHREVKPYAGTSSFDADAWCPDCLHYKLRRAPKKRTPEDYSY